MPIGFKIQPEVEFLVAGRFTFYFGNLVSIDNTYFNNDPMIDGVVFNPGRSYSHKRDFFYSFNEKSEPCFELDNSRIITILDVKELKVNLTFKKGGCIVNKPKKYAFQYNPKYNPNDNNQELKLTLDELDMQLNNRYENAKYVIKYWLHDNSIDDNKFPDDLIELTAQFFIFNTNGMNNDSSLIGYVGDGENIKDNNIFFIKEDSDVS